MKDNISMIHVYTKDLLEPIIQRVKSYFKEEMNIEVSQSEISYPRNIHLKRNTVMIGTSGDIKLILTLGFDDELIKRMVDSFIDDDIEQSIELCDSVICEITNTIVGNAIENPLNDTSIYITPPVLVYEAKTLNKYKNSKFAFVKFNTKFGDIELTAVGPKEQFKDELEF